MKDQMLAWENPYGLTTDQYRFLRSIWYLIEDRIVYPTDLAGKEALAKKLADAIREYDEYRTKLIGDLSKLWTEGGLEALRSVKDNDPSTFVRVVAGLMPKDVNVKHTLIEQVREMSDDEIIKRLRSLQDECLPALQANSASENPHRH